MTIQLTGLNRIRLIGSGKIANSEVPVPVPVPVPTPIPTAAYTQTPTSSGLPPPIVSGPLSDLTFYQPTPLHPSAPGYTFNLPVGHIRVTGGTGPYTFALSLANNNANYFIDANTGYVTNYYGGPIGPQADTLTVTVTDGLNNSITRTLPVVKSSASSHSIFLTFVGFEDANVTGNPFFEQQMRAYAFGGDHNGSDTIVYTVGGGYANLFDVEYAALVPKYGTGLPIPPGSYPIHITTTSATETLVLDYTLNVGPVPAIGAFHFVPGITSTSQQPGTVVGIALATTPTNGRLWSINGADAAYFNVEGPTGKVTLAQTPPLRTLNFSLTCVDRLATRTEQVSINVVQGVTLPPTNMTLSVNPNLDNYAQNQTIGTPVITGLSSTPQWSINFEEYLYQPGYLSVVPLFNVDTTTGHTTAPAQLSNWTYQLTYNVTDGVYSCTQTFSVPVAWVANGPTLYVGQGMAATHGANGFEHLVDLMGYFTTSNLGTMAGATVVIAYNSDPNYYAEDNASGLNGVTRTPLTGDRRNDSHGWNGPIKFVSANTNGPRPRLGGTLSAAYGGYDLGGKGFFNLANGDVVFDGLEISFVTCGSPDNNSAMSGIRKNGDTYGDVTIRNCAIHDCNNGVLSGAGPYRMFIHDNEIYNCGTAYDGQGATHGCYIGHCIELQYYNNLAWRMTNGHNLKTRAHKGTITYNRIYDSERGSASCQVEIPSGGVYYVGHNKLHKGANAQNPFCIQFCAEYNVYLPANQDPKTNALTVEDNDIVMASLPYNHYGNYSVVKHYGVISDIDGSQSTVTMNNNRVFMMFDANLLNETHATGHTATTVITNQSTLAAPFALDFTHPGSASPGPARPSFLLAVQDNVVTFDNFHQVQIDPGSDDIQVSSTAALGTVLGTCTAYGADLYKRFSLTDARINPFTNGTTWQIVQAGMYYQFNNPLPWAPVGRYAINANTGVLTVAGTLPKAGSMDFVKIRATAPNGTLCDYRFSVVITT